MLHLLSTGATDVLILAFATISGILVARLLGPAGRGEFAVAILWPSVLVAVGNLGLREAFTYEMAMAPSLRANLTVHVFVLAVGQSILLIGLGYLLIPWLTHSQAPEVTRSALGFLWSIPASLLAAYALGVLQGDLAIPIFNIIRLSVNSVYLAAILILWALDRATVWNLTFSLLLGNSFAAVLAVFTIAKKYGVGWRIDFPFTRRLLAYGVRSHIGSISSMLNQRMDIMLMALVLSPVQLGFYTAAVNISGLARLGSGVFTTLIFPKVAASTAVEQRKAVLFYSRLNSTITAATGLGLMAVIPILIPLLYGPAFRPSIVSGEILSVAALVVGVGQVWGGVLRGLGHPMLPAKAEMISLGITVLALALTLRPFGILGASITSVVAYFVSSVFMFLHLRRLLDVNLRDLLWPISPGRIRSEFGGWSSRRSD